MRVAQVAVNVANLGGGLCPTSARLFADLMMMMMRFSCLNKEIATYANLPLVIIYYLSSCDKSTGVTICCDRVNAVTRTKKLKQNYNNVGQRSVIGYFLFAIVGGKS